MPTAQGSMRCVAVSRAARRPRSRSAAGRSASTSSPASRLRWTPATAAGAWSTSPGSKRSAQVSSWVGAPASALTGSTRARGWLAAARATAAELAASEHRESSPRSVVAGAASTPESGAVRSARSSACTAATGGSAPGGPSAGDVGGHEGQRQGLAPPDRYETGQRRRGFGDRVGQRARPGPHGRHPPHGGRRAKWPSHRVRRRWGKARGRQRPAGLLTPAATRRAGRAGGRRRRGGPTTA